MSPILITYIPATEKTQSAWSVVGLSDTSVEFSTHRTMINYIVNNVGPEYDAASMRSRLFKNGNSGVITTAINSMASDSPSKFCEHMNQLMMLFYHVQGPIEIQMIPLNERTTSNEMGVIHSMFLYCGFRKERALRITNIREAAMMISLTVQRSPQSWNSAILKKEIDARLDELCEMSFTEATRIINVALENAFISEQVAA